MSESDDFIFIFLVAAASLLLIIGIGFVVGIYVRRKRKEKRLRDEKEENGGLPVGVKTNMIIANDGRQRGEMVRMQSTTENSRQDCIAECLTCSLIQMGSSVSYSDNTCPQCGANTTKTFLG